MSARTPVDVDMLFFDAMNRGDLEAAVALHEPDARWYQNASTVVTGRAAIRDALSEFLALKPQFTVDVVAMGDTGGTIALTRARWRLEGVDAGGAPVVMAATSAEIVRRQSDGSWLFAVIAPGSE